MFCFLHILVALLPATVIASSNSVHATEIYTRIFLEQLIKPCLVDKTCSSEFHVDYNSVLAILGAIKDFHAPAECKCSLDSENCTRKCYYARVVQITRVIAVAKKGNDETPEQSIKKYLDDLEKRVKPCVFEGIDCTDPQEIIFGPLNIDRIKRELQSLESLSILPDGCKCDLTSESCVRPCYYSVIEKHNLGAIKPAAAVVILLSAPFKYVAAR